VRGRESPQQGGGRREEEKRSEVFNRCVEREGGGKGALVIFFLQPRIDGAWTPHNLFPRATEFFFRSQFWK
jgi:hypothetical protein